MDSYTFFSTVLGLLQAAAAPPSYSFLPFNFGYSLRPAIAKKLRRRARSHPILYLFGMEHSFSVYVRLRHF
jgi:hypothetical protein